MADPIAELPGLWVSLDQIEYSSRVPSSQERPYGFIYYITIHNDSSSVVTIKGRKWVVTSDSGEKIVTEGEGVLGETPRLTPGTEFRYNSYHLVSSNSVAEGAYLGQLESGGRVLARIPSFKMEIPAGSE